MANRVKKVLQEGAGCAKTVFDESCDNVAKTAKKAKSKKVTKNLAVKLERDIKDSESALKKAYIFNQVYKTPKSLSALNELKDSHARLLHQFGIAKGVKHKQSIDATLSKIERETREEIANINKKKREAKKTVKNKQLNKKKVLISEEDLGPLERARMKREFKNKREQFFDSEKALREQQGQSIDSKDVDPEYNPDDSVSKKKDSRKQRLARRKKKTERA